MTQQEEIEKELDSMENSDTKYSDMWSNLIGRWIESKIEQSVGCDDKFDHTQRIPNYHEDTFKYFSPTDNPRVLYVFNHSGLQIPGMYREEYKDTNWKTIANTVKDNHDIGSRWIATKLLPDLEENNSAVLFYDITRIVADSNRLERNEQFVDQPYRGEGIWKESIDKDKLGKYLVDPLYQFTAELLKTNDFELIFYIHTMDKYGGGNASGNHEIASNSEQRPHAMIFSKYTFETRPFGEYGPDNQIDFNLLDDKQIEIVQQTFVSSLSDRNEDIQIKVDFPYISPRQFCGFVSQFYTGPQLVLDIRKDLFTSNANQVLRAIKDTSVKLLTNGAK